MSSAPENHQTSTDYELIVKSIYEQILRRDGIANIEVKHNQFITGKSGVSHQIDVMWHFKQAGIEHVVLVECKNYSSTVELGHVRNFKSVLDDVGIARGVMVTKVGFQSGANDFAKFNGIDLKLARTPVDSDWEGLVRHIKVNIIMKTFDTRIAPQVNFNLPKEHAANAAGAIADGNATEVQLLDQFGQSASVPMGQWLPQNVPILDKVAGGPYIHEVKTPGKHVRLKKPDGQTVLVPVDSITVTYHVSEINSGVNVHADDLVTQVLKDFSTGEVEHFLRSAPKPKMI
jgi:Restriction endonuclease